MFQYTRSTGTCKLFAWQRPTKFRIQIRHTKVKNKTKQKKIHFSERSHSWSGELITESQIADGPGDGSDMIWHGSRTWEPGLNWSRVISYLGCGSWVTTLSRFLLNIFGFVLVHVFLVDDPQRGEEVAHEEHKECGAAHENLPGTDRRTYSGTRDGMTDTQRTTPSITRAYACYTDCISL